MPAKTRGKYNLPRVRVSKEVDTLSDGDAARSKINDFRTALCPLRYHPCFLENPLVSGFSLTRCFSAAPVAEKTKCGVLRRKKANCMLIYRLTRGKYNLPRVFVLLLRITGGYTEILLNSKSAVKQHFCVFNTDISVMPRLKHISGNAFLALGIS